MGGSGSGRSRKVKFTDAVKNMIIVARSHNVKWLDIAQGLGYPDTDALENFRRDNPDFEAECKLSFLKRKLNFANKLEKAALPDNGDINTTLAVKIAEKYGILEKDIKTPLAAFQINNGDNPGIQVSFVEAQPAQIIDAERIGISDGKQN